MLAESIRDIRFWVHVAIAALDGGGIHGGVLSVLVPFSDCLRVSPMQGDRGVQDHSRRALVQQLVYPGIARALMDSCLWVERSRRA